jgi:hypothetical protein
MSSGFQARPPWFDSVKNIIETFAARPPNEGRQYTEVDRQMLRLQACVSACHSLNGLEEGETWRSVGLLVSAQRASIQQHVTTAPCC